MPIYVYRCRSCSERFDELVRSDTPDQEVPCPSCGERQAKKQVSGFAGLGRGGSSRASSNDRCGPSGFS